MNGVLFFESKSLGAEVSKDKIRDLVLNRLELCWIYRVEAVEKPWGWEFEIGIDEVEEFVEAVFGDWSVIPLDVAELPERLIIMVIEEGKRLSWHVHNEKHAFLKVVSGVADAYISHSDLQPEPEVLREGELLDVLPGFRHRLGSSANWVVVGEVASGMSGSIETGIEDIRRISDDFKRES